MRLSPSKVECGPALWYCGRRIKQRFVTLALGHVGIRFCTTAGPKKDIITALRPLWWNSAALLKEAAAAAKKKNPGFVKIWEKREWGREGGGEQQKYRQSCGGWAAPLHCELWGRLIFNGWTGAKWAELIGSALSTYMPAKHTFPPPPPPPPPAPACVWVSLLIGSSFNHFMPS